MRKNQWTGLTVIACAAFTCRHIFAQAINYPTPDYQPTTPGQTWFGDPNSDSYWSTLTPTSHSAFNAVDSSGDNTYNYHGPYEMIGVLLNNPGTLLDSTPNYDPNYNPYTDMGGQWEVFFQAAAVDKSNPNYSIALADGANPNDFGGTEAYMVQNGGNITGNVSDSYPNAQWTSEIQRVSTDDTAGGNGQPLHAGELIEVFANDGLSYQGQYNINEAHSSSPHNNFYIKVLDANYGMPTAQVTPLSVYEDTSNSQYFDPTRATGGEHYEGDWVEITDVQFVGSPTLSANGSYTIEDVDADGRTFTVQLGTGDFTGAPTSGDLDIYGIENQVSASGTDGYFISVPDASDIVYAPEPASLAMLGSGTGLLLLRKRSRR